MINKNGWTSRARQPEEASGNPSMEVGRPRLPRWDFLPKLSIQVFYLCKLPPSIISLYSLCSHLDAFFCPISWIAVRAQCERVIGPRMASHSAEEETQSGHFQMRQRARPCIWNVLVSMNFLKQGSSTLCHFLVR